MVSTRLTIKMIETAINKGIRDIKDEPKRGIRNLVDLANHFASSPFQRDILELMQTMLANLDSPYYDIVLNIIDNVDHDTIKTFGINLGYRSWTFGSKKIRQHKKYNNYNIPWTIIFDFRAGYQGKLMKEEIEKLVQEGKEIGIYTYMFFIDNIEDMNAFSNTAKENLDCAFVLYTAPDILRKESICKLKSYNNTFFGIQHGPSINKEVLNNAIELLRKEKCLFGLYSYYGNKNIKNILSGKWANEIISQNAPFGILIESEDCSKKNASFIQDYVLNSKMNQEHSTFLINLYEDIALINRNISGESSFLTIIGNGDSYSGKLSKKEKLNIRNMPLSKLLSELS